MIFTSVSSLRTVDFLVVVQVPLVLLTSLKPLVICRFQRQLFGQNALPDGVRLRFVELNRTLLLQYWQQASRTRRKLIIVNQTM